MKKYLIDTNICIFYFKGKYALDKKFEAIGAGNCFISEITSAELKFGIANSDKIEKNQKVLDDFLSAVHVIPIFHSLDLYAHEKARLRKTGTPLDDFDLLIGATAVIHRLIMVTNNTEHFNRIKGIQLEDWSN